MRRSPVFLVVLVLTLLASAGLAQRQRDAGGERGTASLYADVRDFGAVGDGKADDTEAIRKAVASGRGVVRIGKGVYRITSTILVELDKTGFVSLEGDGVGQVVMAGPGPAFRFLGTHLTGSADPGTFRPNVWERQRMPRVNGLEIVGAHPDADGVEVEGAMQFTMSGARLGHLRHGLRLVNRNRNILVDGCHIYENRGIGIFYDNVSLHQSNIVGSHISYCGGGGIVLRGGDVRNVHIGSCDIESNHDPKGPPTANVLIDCSPSYSGTAEVAITGCTIQHNSTSPGSANIRILGRGKADAPGAKNARPSQRWGHVAITGNVLSDVKTNLHLRGCRDVAVTGNTFWMGFEHNLLVEDCSDVTVTGNVLDRNPAYAHSSAEKATNNVIFRNSRDCVLSGNHLKGVSHSEAALLLEDCDRFNLTGCTLLDNDRAGIVARRLTNSRISDCIIRDDRAGKTTPSIKIEGGKNNQVVDNLTN
ncbi:MAG: right-handed parallel beta-helix repeat-containing protein [Actinomycetota bacterium]